MREAISEKRAPGDAVSIGNHVEAMAKQLGFELIVHVNPEALAPDGDSS